MYRKATDQLVDVSHPQEIEKEHSSAARVPNRSTSGGTPPPRWIRPKRAANLYSIGLTKIFALIKDGRLESKKIDGMRLISVASLEELGR